MAKWEQGSTKTIRWPAKNHATVGSGPGTVQLYIGTAGGNDDFQKGTPFASTNNTNTNGTTTGNNTNDKKTNKLLCVRAENHLLALAETSIVVSLPNVVLSLHERTYADAL